MRLGLLLAGNRTAREAAEIARRAEDSGFADVWVAEDYFERGAFTVAAAVALATHSCRIGIGVVNPWTRHPMLTAMEFAALHELSAGRAVLGLSTGNRVWMQDRCGIDVSDPLTAVDEAVAVIRTALRGEQVHTSGRHLRVDARLSEIAPMPDVSVYVGAKGPRALKRAGVIGDGVLLSLLSSTAYIAWARERCGTEIDCAAYVLAACSEDRDAARRSVRGLLATFLGVHGDHDIVRVAGLDSDRAQRFRAGWLAGTPTEDLIDDELIDTFALAGTISDCRAGLDRYAAAGLDCAILRDPGSADLDGILALANDYRHAFPAPLHGAERTSDLR